MNNVSQNLKPCWQHFPGFCCLLNSNDLVNQHWGQVDYPCYVHEKPMAVLNLLFVYMLFCYHILASKLGFFQIHVDESVTFLPAFSLSVGFVPASVSFLPYHLISSHSVLPVCTLTYCIIFISLLLTLI